MPLSADEYRAIIADDTKRIVGDIAWESRPNAPTRWFRVEVDPNPVTLYSSKAGIMPAQTSCRMRSSTKQWAVGSTVWTWERSIPIRTAIQWERSTRTTGVPPTATSGLTCLMTSPSRGIAR